MLLFTIFLLFSPVYLINMYVKRDVAVRGLSWDFEPVNWFLAW